MRLKYLVIVGDGMADYAMEQFNGKTALQHAKTPNFDKIARNGLLGLVKTIPDSLPPGSDTANLSVMGYNPLKFYTGRSPFEAISVGVEMAPEDVSFRCNLVTLSNEDRYQNKTMVDYCADEISDQEAGELIEVIDQKLGTDYIKFHKGFLYRNLMIWSGAPDDWQLTPPHDISGQKIGEHLPAGQKAADLTGMMKRSHEILSEHPVNKKRVDNGLNPANSIWIWGNGRKPMIPEFEKQYGLKGAVISAVDLMKGIGLFAGLSVIEVEGATGNIDTNYSGKVNAALEALNDGKDFVYLHIEAPDECSHRFEIDNKVKAIELIDQKVVKVVLDELGRSNMEYSILLVTDHATPLSLGTHTREPVPFAIFRSNKNESNPEQRFDEVSAAETGFLIKEGYKLMDLFVNN